MSNGPANAPSELRYLIRDTTTGSTGASLANLNTSELPDGAAVYVIAEEYLYFLDKSSSAAQALPAIVAPAAGGPGRWLGSPVAAAAVSSVFGRTGAVVAVAGDYDTDEVTNVSEVPGATASDALDALAAAAERGVLWVVSNNGPEIVGYTADQFAASYSGEPAVRIGYGSSFGVNANVVSDDALVCMVGSIALVIPRELQGSSRTLSQSEGPGLFRTPASAGAVRSVHELANGRFYVINTNFFIECSRAQLFGAIGFDAITPLTLGSSGGSFDPQLDADENLWYSEFFNSLVRRITAASLSSGGPGLTDKLASGSNFADIGAQDIDATGGIWFSSYSLGLRYYDAAAIAALTNVASNPAPTRTLTITGYSGLTGFRLTRGGNAWVASYDDNALLYLTAAQLLAGGAQAPTRVIDITNASFGAFGPQGVALSVGFGLHLR